MNHIAKAYKQPAEKPYKHLKKKKNHVANFTDVKYILYLDDRTEIQGSEDSIFNVTHYIDLRRLMKLSGQKSRTKMKMPD